MSTGALVIKLTNGETALVVSSDGAGAIIDTPTAAPPGATLTGKVDGVRGDFELKVKNCRRIGEVFRVEGRLRNATRELKAHLTKDEHPR